MKGFPGLLNTMGTLLDRSQTIKQIFKKCQKTKGPMGPRGLGPWALWAPGTLGPNSEKLGSFQQFTKIAPKDLF